MADIFGISVSGLLSSQRALNTAAHNVANVNTEGYSRQRVDLATRNPQFTGAGFIGSGVEVSNIRRSYNEFLTLEIRDSISSTQEYDRFYKLAAQMDNLIADPRGSLSPAMQGFFNAVQDVSNDPASAPARQTMLTSAETMVDRFRFFDTRLDEQYRNVNSQMGNILNGINSLAQGIADVNRAIVDVGGNNGGPVSNDLLDRRDLLLGKLAELAAVSKVDQDDGSILVFIGNGQVLVNRFDTQEVTLVDNEFDASRSEVGIRVGANDVDISSNLRGGQLGGVMDFRRNVLDSARNALGRIGLSLVNDFNAQHRLGMDLGGSLGADFFSISGMSGSGATAKASSNNTTTTGVTYLVTDPSALTTSDYRLTYNGANKYTLMRLSDQKTTAIDASSGYPYTTAAIDGFTVSIAAAPTLRDSFLVQPTANAISSIDLLIKNTAEIAAAGAVRTTTAANNTGLAVINEGTLVDETAYVNDTYSLIMADSTAAVANGTVGTITDNNSDSTLQYALTINNTVVYTQSEAAAPLADLTALASAINGASDVNVGITGVKAYVDTTNNVLYLANVPSSPAPITVTESLTTSAGTVEDGDTVTGYFGSVLTGSSTPSVTLPAFSREANSYFIEDSSGAYVAAGTYTSGNTISFNGIEVAVSKTANLGDNFTIAPNLNGISDSRNALSLAALQRTASLDNGTATYQDAYGSMAAKIGARTNQALINYEAQDALLNNALAAQAEVSGVNLDEEAADMLRFQQMYMASSRLIQTAESMFQELLGVLRR